MTAEDALALSMQYTDDAVTGGGGGGGGVNFVHYSGNLTNGITNVIANNIASCDGMFGQVHYINYNNHDCYVSIDYNASTSDRILSNVYDGKLQLECHLYGSAHDLSCSVYLINPTFS